MTAENQDDKINEIAALLTSLTYGELLTFGQMLVDVATDQQLDKESSQEWAAMLHFWATTYEPEARS